MKQVFSIQKNENGSILIIALAMSAFLTLIGLAASRTSGIELQIAGNDKVRKMTFYAADSGVQVAASWLDIQYPPVTTNSSVPASPMPGDNTITYSYSTAFNGAANSPGYGTDFKRYRYTIESTGNAPGNAQSSITVTASKVFFVGGY